MKPIYQQIADDLRTQIRRGVFERGDRLPSETDLIEAYGVSQGTIRQAKSVLEREGLIIGRQGRGMYVHMRMPFAKLMELVRTVDQSLTLGELSERWNEPAGRIADAVDANKVVDGERGYI